jgi:hypothetical protein
MESSDRKALQDIDDGAVPPPVGYRVEAWWRTQSRRTGLGTKFPFQMGKKWEFAVLSTALTA